MIFVFLFSKLLNALKCFLFGVGALAKIPVEKAL